MREGWSANEKTVDTSLDPPSVPSQPQALLPLMGSTGTDWGDRQKDLLTWYDNAQEQLARLKKPYFIRGGSTKSTGRLSVPKQEKLQPMQHMPSCPRIGSRADATAEEAHGATEHFLSEWGDRQAEKGGYVPFCSVQCKFGASLRAWMSRRPAPGTTCER